MREGTKREIRIYQDHDFEVLSITSWGEGTTKRKKAVEGLPWGGEHVTWRTVMKAKAEEDCRFSKMLLIIHPLYFYRWFQFHSLAPKKSNCWPMLLHQHLKEYF